MKNLVKGLFFCFFLVFNVGLQAQDFDSSQLDLDGKVFAVKLMERPSRALFSDGDNSGAVKDGFYTARWKKQFWLFEKVDEEVYMIRNIADNRYLSVDAYENRGVSVLRKEVGLAENFNWKLEVVVDGVFVVKSVKEQHIITFGDFKRTEVFLADYKDDSNQFVSLDHIENIEIKKSKLFTDKSSLVSANK